MIPFGRRVVVLGSLLAAAGGCGSSGSSSASVAAACQTVAEARCAQQSSCSLPEGMMGVGYNLLSNYGDLATCVARQVTACTNGLDAPQTGNSPTKVTMCAANLLSQSCTDFFDNTPPADCAPTGSRQNGAACTFSGQCTSGYCQGTKAATCGIPRRPARRGRRLHLHHLCPGAALRRGDQSVRDGRRVERDLRQWPPLRSRPQLRR